MTNAIRHFAIWNFPDILDNDESDDGAEDTNHDSGHEEDGDDEQLEIYRCMPMFSHSSLRSGSSEFPTISNTVYPLALRNLFFAVLS